MRLRADRERLTAFMDEIGKAAKGPGKVYFVGGTTAMLLGFRDQTIDIDIAMEPEPKGVFDAIASLKNRLEVNVELASPRDFLPELPGWQGRSEFIGRSGPVDFYHYDFYAQALGKILRGHGQDLDDARGLLRIGKVDPARLIDLFEQIKPEIIRYPAVDVQEFEERLRSFLESEDSRDA